MTRRFGIIVALLGVLGVVVIDWTLGVPPDPFRAPDPMAIGSTSGASGAICTFTPGAQQ